MCFQLGFLNCISPLWPDGYYRMDLSFPDERQMASVLCLLAMEEPGDNVAEEKYSFRVDDTMAPPRKGLDYQRGWKLPKTWSDPEHGVPERGAFEMRYRTPSEKCICEEYRMETRAQFLAGTEL